MKQDHPESNLSAWLSTFLPEENHSQFIETIQSKPGRISKGYKELFQGYEIDSAQDIISVTEELKEKRYSGLISGLDIPFLSFCEHHFLPFHGTIDIVYEPDKYILGIGKLSRLADYRTKRFNIQEHIAEELCNDLMTVGAAKGAFARVKAKHMCLCYRGPKKYDSSNTVCYWSGSLLDSERKSEISLILN
ncbi:MAG: GTP cyclohydrolase I [Phormidesmis sp.]